MEEGSAYRGKAEGPGEGGCLYVRYFQSMRNGPTLGGSLEVSGLEKVLRTALAVLQMGAGATDTW